MTIPKRRTIATIRKDCAPINFGKNLFFPKTETASTTLPFGSERESLSAEVPFEFPVSVSISGISEMTGPPILSNRCWLIELTSPSGVWESELN